MRYRRLVSVSETLSLVVINRDSGAGLRGIFMGVGFRRVAKKSKSSKSEHVHSLL